MINFVDLFKMMSFHTALLAKQVYHTLKFYKLRDILKILQNGSLHSFNCSFCICLRGSTVLQALLLNAGILQWITLSPTIKKHLYSQGKHVLIHITKKFKLSMGIEYIHRVDYLNPG